MLWDQSFRSVDLGQSKLMTRDLREAAAREWQSTNAEISDYVFF